MFLFSVFCCCNAVLSIYDTVPVAAPENVHAVVRNSTLVEVFWDPVPAHLIRGNIKGYKVPYKNRRQCNMCTISSSCTIYVI